MDNLLEIKNLKVSFKLEDQLIKAVDGVTLSLRRNETLVVAGESGSGKSVTALAVTRILPAHGFITDGEVFFEGVNTLLLSEKELGSLRGKQISYIFQEPTAYLNPTFSIGNQIIETIMLHQGKNKAEAFKEAAGLLSQVKISDPVRVLRSYPHQLSGGMNQRVLIAMGLACRPKLLIADEPTTALDVTVESEVLRLLMELKKSFGFSLLFITHNLSIAKKIADRVCVMHRGKVVEEGSRDAVFATPSHEHTRELIEAYEKIGKI